ncbi:MAG: hypothetical protein VB859_16910, partial [Planctomycetaceae bacterium]
MTIRPILTTSLWLLLLVPVPVAAQRLGKPAQPGPFKQAGILEAWSKFGDRLSFGKGQTLALVDDGCTLSKPEWARSAGD